MTTWRAGRKVGRTIYEQIGSRPSDDDNLIGVMDTPELAQAAVEAYNARGGRQVIPTQVIPTPEELARQFHETYERLAPEYGYETRKESAVAWGDVPESNRLLMIATVAEVTGPILSALEAARTEKEKQDWAIERWKEEEADWYENEASLIAERNAAIEEARKLREAGNELAWVAKRYDEQTNFHTSRLEPALKAWTALSTEEGK